MEEFEIGPQGESEAIDYSIISMPSHHDLIEVGFTEDAAHEILDKYPDKAQEFYDIMKRVDLSESNALDVLEQCGVKLQSFYNGPKEIGDHSDSENTMNGSCDCRSECKYNTGHTYKYANYGYSD